MILIPPPYTTADTSLRHRVYWLLMRNTALTITPYLAWLGGSHAMTWLIDRGVVAIELYRITG